VPHDEGMPFDHASLLALHDLLAAPPHEINERLQQKMENLWAAYCLHFAYYNFCRVHSSIRVTPAMESKITDPVWTLGELLA
jgi:hypothetical protein